MSTRRRAAAKAATPAPEAAEPTEVTEVTETTEATTEPVVDTTTEEAPATTADTETADATDAAPAADIGPVKTATTTATAVTTPAPAPATTASTASRVGDPFVEFPAAAPATLSAGARDALTEAIAQGWLRSNGLQKSLYTRLDSLPDEAADTLVNKFVTKLEERVAAKDVFLDPNAVLRSMLDKEDMIRKSQLGEERERRVQEYLEERGFTLDVSSTERRCGGPPPGWEADKPAPEKAQAFLGHLPTDCFEDELLPYVEQFGSVYETRILMSGRSGENRGFGFVVYADRETMLKAIEAMPTTPLREGWFLEPRESSGNSRLFLGGVSRIMPKDELDTRVRDYLDGVLEVIVYRGMEAMEQNRGFCFVEFADHSFAEAAHKKISDEVFSLGARRVNVDWAKPEAPPSGVDLSKVTSIYVSNLVPFTNDKTLQDTFSKFGEITSIRHIRTFAFVTFAERASAEKALKAVHNTTIDDSIVQVVWARPSDDRKRSSNGSFGGGPPGKRFPHQMPRYGAYAAPYGAFPPRGGRGAGYRGPAPVMYGAPAHFQASPPPHFAGRGRGRGGGGSYRGPMMAASPRGGFRQQGGSYNSAYDGGYDPSASGYGAPQQQQQPGYGAPQQQYQAPAQQQYQAPAAQGYGQPQGGAYGQPQGQEYAQAGGAYGQPAQQQQQYAAQPQQQYQAQPQYAAAPDAHAAGGYEAAPDAGNYYQQQQPGAAGGYSQQQYGAAAPAQAGAPAAQPNYYGAYAAPAAAAAAPTGQQAAYGYPAYQQ